ncbi:MAG: hypothetical protein KDK90_10875 [Leptospiraceae bacterium]|nr:hypothetical protein [Leptospiraceae bacterium]
MNFKTIGIFQIVEIAFFISILINFASYLTGFFMILYNKQVKGFFHTLKEGWSSKYITQNIISLSMVVTSLSAFWFMILISSGIKKVSILAAFKINPYISLYIAVACVGLVTYAIFVFIKNVRKVRDLCSVLSYLSFWMNVDRFFESLGGVVFLPFTATSKFVRKNLIKSKSAEILVSAIVWLVGEYLFKISIVLSVLFLTNLK